MEQLFRPESLSILMIFGVPIVAVVGYYWYKIEKVKSDNNLKQRMLDSGLSVEEIERVLNAGYSKDDDE